MKNQSVLAHYKSHPRPEEEEYEFNDTDEGVVNSTLHLLDKKKMMHGFTHSSNQVHTE
jgi:hypothetical protein